MGAALAGARLIVCCGPGGVGKTTSAASLGLREALAGRRAIVLTIDPARRLADSLGLASLSNDPQRIALDVSLGGAEGGELWAMMLDQERTLDDLVARFAPDPGAAERARSNNIYRLLGSALHGMQEYMALDKLHDLYTSGRYDVVVLDTPPTKNALEFLRTPSRARTFFDDRVIRWFVPSRRAGGLLGRVLDPGSVVLKLLGRVLGDSFVQDLADFFETLEFLQEALRSRGDVIDFILRDEGTRFVIVTSPDLRRVREALFFHAQLGELGQKAAAFLINRVTPEFAIPDGPAPASDEVPGHVLEQMRANARAINTIAERDVAAVEELRASASAEVVGAIPLLDRDVHSMLDLARLSEMIATER